MYRKCIGSDPTAARLDFALYEVAGEWESRSGSPRVRIYRNPGRRGGGFYVEVSYKGATQKIFLEFGLFFFYRNNNRQQPENCNRLLFFL